MDATQQIDDSFFIDEDPDENEQEEKKKREPLATLKIFKNDHIPEIEVPLYLGENILGRDPTSCPLPLQARSVSSRHAIISISVFHTKDRLAPSESTETLLWDLGSLNGTRKGRTKLTPHVRYALTDGDSVVLADLPCQYISLKNAEKHTNMITPEKVNVNCVALNSSSSDERKESRVENVGRKNVLPPVPTWSEQDENGLQSPNLTPKQPETTLVPDSDSDSDGEKCERRDRRRLVVSESPSSEISTSICSTLLTPASKVFPESEDECLIIPSSITPVKDGFLKRDTSLEISPDSSKPDPLRFNLESDTDTEEDEVAESKPEVKAAEKAVTDPVPFYMDSDTDLEDDETEADKSMGNPVVSPASAKQDTLNPAALKMDSDTDEEAELPSASKAVPEQEKQMTSSTEFQINSDSSDGEEDNPVNSNPPADPHAAFHLDSDSEAEYDGQTTKNCTAHDNDPLNQSKAAQALKDTKMPQSDSDTDVEDDKSDVRTPSVAKISPLKTGSVSGMSSCAQHVSPAKVQSEKKLDEFWMDSDTDVEEEEELKENKQKREEAAGIMHSSTPRGAGLALPSLLRQVTSPGTTSQDDDDLAVAETQAFVCDVAPANVALERMPQSLNCQQSHPSGGVSSLRLDLSDSLHQMAEPTENDQSLAEEDWQLQPTLLYDRNLEDNAKTGQMQHDLEATQAYATQIYQEEVKDEEKETQPLDALSSVYTAKTQLIAQEQDNDTSGQVPMEVEVASEFRGGTEEKNDEMHFDSNLSTADTLLIVKSQQQEEETQPFAFLAALKEQDENRDHGVHERTEKNECEHDMNDGLEHKEKICDNMEIKKNESMDAREHEKNKQVRKVLMDDDEEQTQPMVSEDTHVMIAETQPMVSEDMSEEQGGHERQLQSEPRSSIGSCGIRPTTNVEPTQLLEADDIDDIIAQTEDIHKKEQQNKVTSCIAHKRRIQVVEVDSTVHVVQEQTQPIEVDFSDKVHAQDEAKQKKESQNEYSCRRQVVKVAPTLPVDQEQTQPMETDIHVVEEKKKQEDDKQTKLSSRKTSREGSQVAECELAQSFEVDNNQVASVKDVQELNQEQQDVSNSTKTSSREEEQTLHPEADGIQASIDEDLEMCKKEPQVKAGVVKRSHRGRLGTKDLQTKNSVDTRTTTVKKVKQEEKCTTEPSSSRRSSRVRQSAKLEPAHPIHSCDNHVPTLGNEEQIQENPFKASTKRKTDRKTQIAGVEAIVPPEAENHHVVDDEDKNGHNKEQSNKYRNSRRSVRRNKNTKDETVLPLDRDSELLPDVTELDEKEEPSRKSQRGRATSSKAKGKATTKRASTKKKVEVEPKEQEESESENKGLKGRGKGRRKEESGSCEKENKASIEREDKAEKECLENEHGQKDRSEQEKIERETEDKEENEKEKEKRLAGEMREQQEKDIFDNEKREKEMQKKVKEEQKMTKGKQKAGIEKKNDQEIVACETLKQEPEVEMDVKPRRGRRATRKFLAPPADDDVPAKRTRSRSNSSNSVCSVQSTSTLESQSGVRGRSGRRRNAEEPNEQNKPSCSTATVPSDEKEEARSRSNSRSLETSSTNVTTQKRGRGRGRKSIKIEEQEAEEESQHPAPAERELCRGRGKGGKCDVNSEATSKAEKEEFAAVKESVVNQTNSRGRKRGADASILTEETKQPSPKTPRRSTAGQAYKVLFTGVVDEDGERALVRLGGCLAKGVGDMTHLVTDKVRRTVKFLCAVARGVPIVTPDWLTKCGKAESFLSPNGYLVKDAEQEKKFNFKLQESLRAASHQPLLQGYEIHVTPSVKPEPVQMKEIITCCGARYLPKMPSAHKDKVVVVSSEEDQVQCQNAQRLSLPVVSAEFLLTGILQQKVDLNIHALSLSPSTKPAARSRGK